MNTAENLDNLRKFLDEQEEEDIYSTYNKYQCVHLQISDTHTLCGRPARWNISVTQEMNDVDCKSCIRSSNLDRVR